MNDVPAGPALYAFGLARLLQTFDPAAARGAAAAEMDLAPSPSLSEREQPLGDRQELVGEARRSLS